MSPHPQTQIQDKRLLLQGPLSNELGLLGFKIRGFRLLDQAGSSVTSTSALSGATPTPTPTIPDPSSKEGYSHPTLRASLSGTFLQKEGCRKPVFGVCSHPSLTRGERDSTLSVTLNTSFSTVRRFRNVGITVNNIF